MSGSEGRGSPDIRVLTKRLLEDRNVLTAIRGSTGAFVVKVGAAGIAFGLEILLARVLGVSEYGIYAFVFAWLGILVLAAKLGWDIAVVRYVASYFSVRKWSLLAGIIQRARQVVFASGLLVGSGVCTVFLVAGLGGNEQLRWAFLIGALSIPLWALVDVEGSVLRGLKAVVRGNLPGSILRPALLGIGVLVVEVVGHYELSAARVLGLHAAAALIALLVAHVWAEGVIPQAVSRVSAAYRSRTWAVTAMPLLVIAGMNLLLDRTDILMVGGMLGTTEAGLYSVAVRVAALVTFGLTAANAIVAPMIAEFYEKGDIEELGQLLGGVTLALVVLSIPVVAGLVIGREWVLHFFGEPFISGQWALVILLGAQWVNVMAGPVGYLMIMTNYEREAAIILSIVAAVNAGLNALLIPKFGLEGAAVATGLSTVLWNVVMIGYASKVTKINISKCAIGAGTLFGSAIWRSIRGWST